MIGERKTYKLKRLDWCNRSSDLFEFISVLHIYVYSIA